MPNAMMAAYYSQRAAAGLLITEGTSPSPNGLGYARIPGLYSPEQIAYDRARADADLAAGRGDLVAFGRPFLADPRLVDKLQRGAALRAPDPATFYTPGENGDLDWPLD